MGRLSFRVCMVLLLAEFGWVYSSAVLNFVRLWRSSGAISRSCRAESTADYRRVRGFLLTLTLSPRFGCGGKPIYRKCTDF